MLVCKGKYPEQSLLYDASAYQRHRQYHNCYIANDRATFSCCWKTKNYFEFSRYNKKVSTWKVAGKIYSSLDAPNYFHLHYLHAKGGGGGGGTRRSLYKLVTPFEGTTGFHCSRVYRVTNMSSAEQTNMHTHNRRLKFVKTRQMRPKRAFSHQRRARNGRRSYSTHCRPPHFAERGSAHCTRIYMRAWRTASVQALMYSYAQTSCLSVVSVEAKKEFLCMIKLQVAVVSLRSCTREPLVSEHVLLL